MRAEVTPDSNTSAFSPRALPRWTPRMHSSYRREQYMNLQNDWYLGMTKGQKVFVYLVSCALILLAGIGLIPLALLIYLELGLKDRRS